MTWWDGCVITGMNEVDDNCGSISQLPPRASSYIVVGPAHFHGDRPAGPSERPV